MRRRALFILIACTSFTLGIIISPATRFISRKSSPLPAPDSRSTQQPANSSIFPSEEFDLASEISISRIHDGCEGCGDQKIVINRPASNRFGDATVTETDLQTKTERQGKLNAYYFNNLLRFIDEQGYFSMSNQYGMGWVDALVVRIDVRFGEKHKKIVTSNEGDVPIQLWGIYYAIEGARAKVDWQASSVSPQSQKRLGRTNR